MKTKKSNKKSIKVPKLSRKEKITQAAEIAAKVGLNAGNHQWVIDQMLKTMLGSKGYNKWLVKLNDKNWIESNNSII